MHLIKKPQELAFIFRSKKKEDYVPDVDAYDDDNDEVFTAGKKASQSVSRRNSTRTPRGRRSVIDTATPTVPVRQQPLMSPSSVLEEARARSVCRINQAPGPYIYNFYNHNSTSCHVNKDFF